MAYIDETYYTDIFHGTEIPHDEFDRLARIASDLIDSIVVRPIVDVTDGVKNATAYQLEIIHMQGGVEAISGNASGSHLSESLGDYSVSTGAAIYAGSRSMLMINGIPFSVLAISLLRREGLMNRCFYDGCLT